MNAVADPTPAPKLIEVERLSARFAVRRGIFGRPTRWIRAVDDVSFDIYRGETLGLVGESGCGKTTLGRTLLALRPAAGGAVRFNGQSVFDLAAADLKAMRRQMQLVFQDPFASLDPRKTVGQSVRAGLDIHGVGSAATRDALVSEMFRLVGLQPVHMNRYPHEFSGGQRQRVGIARALVLHPQFLVCDEPVSALDVSIQAQILNLLKDLQTRLGMTYLFISHNLAVVEHIADRVAVMYYGRIVEIARRQSLFARPRHPYTSALLEAVPLPDPRRRREHVVSLGDPPDPAELPTGCRFRSRCPRATDRCVSEEPPLAGPDPGHQAACWNPL